MESIVGSIREILDKTEHDADFACQSRLEDAINPGLSVAELGSIGLPISQRDVTALIGQAKQSASGFKSETRVDLSVRRTWEIEADQVHFTHPLWPSKLREIVDDVAHILGVPRGIDAQLNKLLVYEENGMFDKHKDNEEADGMFGTLVIVLPCKHTGGDIVLEHAGERKTFSSAAFSEFGLSYMAWYADVAHQACSISSGYRVALTYNLIHANSVVDLSADSRSGDLAAVSELTDLLCQWEDVSSAENFLVYQLEHKYTEVNMRLDHLKTVDARRGQIAFAAAEAADFDFFLASMEKYVSGGCDEDGYGYGYESEDSEIDEITDVFDTHIELRCVFDSAGKQVTSGIIVKPGQVIQGEDAFDQIDKEDYSGWTGNEGVSATHYYRSTVVLLVQPGFRIKMLMQTKLDQGKLVIKGFINDLTQEYLHADAERKVSCRQSLKTAVIYLLEPSSEPITVTSSFGLSWNKPGPQNCDASILDTAAFAAIALKDGELLLRILGYCTQDQRDPWEYLGQAIVAGLIDSEQSKLQQLLDKHEPASATNILHAVNAGLSVRNAITPGSTASDSQREMFCQCAKSMMNRFSDMDEQPTADDGIALAKLVSLTSAIEPSLYISYIEKHVKQSPFAVAFLAGMIDLDPELTAIQQRIIENLSVQEFYVGHKQFCKERTGTGNIYAWSTTPIERPPMTQNISGNDLAKVFVECFRNGQFSLIPKMNETLLQAAQNSEPSVFEDVLIPFLNDLLGSSRFHWNTRYSKEPERWLENVQTLLKSMIEQYLLRYVLPEPPEQQKSPWAQKPVSCQCGDCKSLNSFLISNERVTRLTMGRDRRKHLHQQLDPRWEETKYETEHTGRVHTLIVSKGKNAVSKEKDAWWQRRKKAEARVAYLCQIGLEKIIGKKELEAVLQTGLREEKPLSKMHVNLTKPAPRLGSGAGTKRALDQENKEDPIVIDLT